MEKVELQDGPAPQAIVRPCGTAMYRPRERTVQELLRHTQKIAAPRPSPVHTDGARMQGPGVKEECCTCGSIIAAEELQQCSACDRGFHSTCLDPLVNIITPEGRWSCGLCDVYNSRAEDTGATDRTAGDSMTSSQNTGGQWNSTASGGKKKLTHTRGLKEVVKQEEASLEDSKSLQTASHEGEASRRSKRGRPLKSTAQVLPLKRRRADAGVCDAKPDDEMASCSVPELLGEAEEPAVEFGGQPVLPTLSCSNDAPASVEAPTSPDERVPFLVVKTESSIADVDNVGSKVSSINDVDKLNQLDATKLKDSDGNLQSLAMKDPSPESNAVVALPRVSDIRMVQVTEFGESDASNKVSDGEIKLQDTGAGTTPSSLDQNVGDQRLNDVRELDRQAVASEQQGTERTCENDPVSTGNEEEDVTMTHAEKEPSVGVQHALDSTANANVETTTGRTSSVASLLISPSPSVRLTSSSPSFGSGPSVSNTSSVSTASPFEGFHSEPRNVTTFTSPVTPQFSKPAPEQGGSDGKISSVAKPLFKASVSSSSLSPIPSPSFVAPSKLEKLPSFSSQRADDKPQPVTSLPQPPVSPTTLPSDVSSSEAPDSQLSNLVSGLPVPSQRARKALQASLSVLEGNGLVTQPARKPKSQTMDISQSGRISKELNKSTIRDQGHVKNAPPKVLENGTSRLDADETVSGRSKDPNAEEDRDGSPSYLLVEDVKVCDTCGNAGYEELLAVCSGCSEGAEHTYCMRFQMDALPDGEWYCETCQMKQRQGGPKPLDRVIVPSKSLGRSTSINNRPKPVTMHNNARSRLTGRLNNKKPRMTPVRKSPSKAPSVQTPVKRSMSDSLTSPVSRKLTTESSSCSSPSTSPPSTVPVSTPSAKPSLTRENTFKSDPDTGKVKFLAPSAVANFSSGARASTAKSASLSSQPLKAAASGQAGNKSSRFASLSSISESSTHSLSKSPSVNTSRMSLTTSPVPVLSKSPSGTLSADFPALTKSSSAKTTADFPSFLLNPNSRQGNGLKGPGQLKNSRDGAVPDGASTPSSGREGLLSASQASGSKLMRLGRNASSSGLTGEFRPSPDTPRPSSEYGRGPQRAGQTGDFRPSPDTPRPTQRPGQVGEPRPSLDTPRPPLEPGRMAQRSGQGSVVAGTGLAQDASKSGGKDKASCRFDPASGVGPAVAGKGTMEPPGFPGKQSKPSTSVWSAPWLGDSCSTRCFSCKAFGHSMHDCPSRNSSVFEHKAVNGSCTSPGTSPKPPGSTRDAIPVLSDIDAHLPSLGTKPGKEVKGNSGLVLHGLQSASELVPGSGIVDYEKSKPLLPSPTPTDPVFKRSSSFKSHDSSAVGSTNSSLFNSTPFQQLVMGQTPLRVSPVGNGDISCNNQGLKAESGGSNPWIPSGTYDNEGPPGVTGTETAQIESKLAAALPKNVSPVARSESCPLVDSSQVTGSKEPQGHAVQSAEAVAAAGGPGPPILQRVHPPAWAPRPPWLEGLPPHNVQGQGPGQGPGHVGYLPGLVQSFTPLSGPVIYGQSPPMSYLTSPPPPLLPPYGGPGPAPIPTHAPLPASPALLDAAVPSAAVAWRGAFEVNDGQSTVLFDEILAHVSTKAVAKVHEVATSLPPQLRLEQVQRSLELETWPRQFSHRPPNDGSIALYFFADNGESFEKFRHNLVETMVARDLVLRAQVDDAELLIFPSNKLSEKFQRWHGHMFLWGVFRAKKQAAKTVSSPTPVIKGPSVASPCIEVAKLPAHYVPTAASICSISSKKDVNLPITGCEGTGEVDMEVDMEGGREFGVSDKAVKRPDSANPPSTPPLSPTGASMRTLAAAPAPAAPAASAAVAFALESAVSDAAADRVQGKAVSIKTDDLDLPPGFAPPLAFPPTPVALEPPTSASSLPPGFGKKLEAQKQDEQGAGADVVDASEMGGSKLKRSLSSLEVVKSSITQQASPLSGPSSRENDGNAPSSRPATTKRSRSLSRSPSRQRERDKVRDKLSERVKERERRELDPKHGGHDRAREWAREVHRDRDRDREYEREKERWDRSKERERARPREKDRGRDRDRAARDRDRDRDGERERGERERDRAERESDRDRERERLMERSKDRKHRSRDLDQDLDSRARYRRSRSRSRSRSLARRKARSRSPVSGRRKARSRTPPRQRSRSPLPSRRYRRRSVSGSDSPDSQSLEILQGSAMTGTRSRKSDRDSLQGKRNASDKEGGDKSSRPRWKARSGSAGASNSKTVGKLGHPHTVPASRSVTPVLDMNEEGVSEAFSAEGAAAASTSLPDLNTDSVESGVAFHEFLPADDGMPVRESDPASQPMAEQTFFPRAGAGASGATPGRTHFQRQDSDPPISARERLGAAVSSLGFASRLEYNHSHASTRSASGGYQFLHPPRLDSDSVYNPNPNLELALGGRERSPEVTVPLRLFADGHARRSPDLAFGLHPKSPELSVGLGTPHPQGSSAGGTASLSLSLAVPQYRKEGNSWVEVEQHGRGVLVSDDVDFALTL